ALDVQAETVVQKLATPKQIEPPGSIGDFADGEGPGFAQRQYAGPREFCGGGFSRGITVDIFELRPGNVGVTIGSMIELQPEHDPHGAENSRGQEGVLPVRAIGQDDHRNNNGSENGANV